ncbi:MAG: ABC transporter permease subunit [Spirochaetaceae bacterium]|jgi:putative spermidine/putrescine transport system permease protein|nr:ABC transporter permease subunit [Spirochaetaceae bacterium]
MKPAKAVTHIIHALPVLPFLLLALLFLFLPMVSMVVKSFVVPGVAGYSIRNYIDIFTQRTTLACIRNSLYLSFLSAFIGLFISFVAALSVTRITDKGKGRYLSFLNMFSNFAGLPLAYAFMFMVGNAGIFTLILRVFNIDLVKSFNLYSSNGILVLFVYFQIPLGTLLMFPAFQAIRPEWREAAELMRASGIQFWWRVGLPALIPSLAGTFGMLFANALTAYATPFMLMSTNFPLLPIKITSMYTGEMAPQPEMGSALSLVMVAIMLSVIGLCNLFRTVFYKGGYK